MKSIFILLLLPTLFLSKPDSETTLLKYSKEIKVAAEKTGISPRLLASIIYAEHKLNYTLTDKVLDGVLAHIGYNSSVGVAQIKVNTAEWIERQLHNKKSPFYLGDDISFMVTISKDREQIIDKLSKPEINIFYAACYAAMIEKYWRKEFNAFSLGDKKVGIIATLYCLGIIKSNGEMRYPHRGAKMNNFGKTAEEFYDSFLLRSEFN